MSAYRRGVRLALTVSPIVSEAIDNLLATGLFGRSRAEVAQRLLYRFFQDPSNREFERLGAELRARKAGKR
jgi:hypothetical protein